MALTDYLQTAASKALGRARQAGLPVDDAGQFVSERLEPLVIKHVSRYVIPFVRRSGVCVLELEPGRVLCEMPLKGNVNHIGTMYAGALFTLAEFPGGPLMLGTFGLRRFIPIVTALDMEFIKAAKENVRVELSLAGNEAARIEAETLEQGRAEFELNGELVSVSGELIARSRACYQMRPRRRG